MAEPESGEQPELQGEPGERRVVAVTARVVGGFSTPGLKDFRRYLQSLGFRHARGGKGDHEKWIHAETGIKFDVNASRRDRKHVDVACVKTLAKMTHTSVPEVMKDIGHVTRTGGPATLDITPRADVEPAAGEPDPPARDALGLDLYDPASERAERRRNRKG